MEKIKGFKLRRKLVKVFNWCIHRRTRRRSAFRRLRSYVGPISKLRRWVHSLTGIGHSGYIRAGQEPVEPLKLPKGHLAVYVGDKEEDTCRVLVPVIYFNHPLFGELLSEAEKVYGFNHAGGIQIPCPKSELENIQMRIAAVSGGGRWRRRRS